jgi:hypothetical protein
VTPARIVCALVVLVPGLIGLARPRTILAFENWVQTRLRKRQPLPQSEARVRTMGLIETVLGALLLATALS